jgi:hypothetical protein
MTDQSASDRLARKVRRLSLGVWILAILLCGTLFVSYVVLRSVSVASSSFDRLSPVQQIQTSSVIALAKWQTSGSTLRCVISEILKQAPDTAFYYKVGDEFRHGNQRVSEGTDYGDGQVLFFTGSPARLEVAVAVHRERISGMGDMPVSTLRDLIRNSTQ